MKTSKLGLDLIRHFEGFQSHAYICPAGVLTIGYGTTTGVKKGQVITETQGEKFLARDLSIFEKAVNDSVKADLTQPQFDALVAFTYNVGAEAFKSSSLLKAINEGHLDQVPAQLMRWNKGGGKVLAGLTSRRAAEGNLFAHGVNKF